MFQVSKETDFSIISRFLTSVFSSPTHWPFWNEAVSRYFKTDFYYYTAREDGEIVGVMPVHEKKSRMFNTLSSGQFGYIPYGGWLFSKPVENISIKSVIGGRSKIEVFSLPGLPQFGSHTPAGIKNSFETLVVDLSRSEEEIWGNSIESKRRNLVRKFEKTGGVVEIADAKKIPEYYNYYDTANRKYGIPSLPQELMTELIGHSGNPVFELLVAKLGDDILGMNVLCYDKDYALYLMGVGVEGAASIGQGEYLQWYSIKRVREHGCKYYDLCYVEKDRLPHIYKFKKGFSDQEAKINFYREQGNFSYIFRRFFG